jgi:hypothetical protein
VQAVRSRNNRHTAAASTTLQRKLFYVRPAIFISVRIPKMAAWRGYRPRCGGPRKYMFAKRQKTRWRPLHIVTLISIIQKM